jgi:hypothetical protein
MRDFDYVKRCIENPKNEHKHIEPLHNLIVNFGKKWFDYKYTPYLYSLQDLWRELDEKLFDVEIEKIKNNEKA